MKLQFSFVAAAIFCFNTVTNAQDSAVGTYEQTAINAPAVIRNLKKEVAIRQDAQATNSIWIDNLLPDGSLFASMIINNESMIYSIPKQKVGNYQVNIGCVVYNVDGGIVISLNNKYDCLYTSPINYDDISVGDGKVKVGDIKINEDGNGSVETGTVVVKEGNVSVDAKTILGGVQYVGNKKQ
jgi:hypothetical protein